jgi:aspartate aminotransferase-like enzyme
VAHLCSNCRPGDTVVVMSSGGFGGFIEKLLRSLEGSGTRQAEAARAGEQP